VRLLKKILNEWIKNFARDCHHFRIILSPENAHELDMTDTKFLVKQMEKKKGQLTKRGKIVR